MSRHIFFLAVALWLSMHFFLVHETSAKFVRQWRSPLPRRRRRQLTNSKDLNDGRLLETKTFVSAEQVVVLLLVAVVLKIKWHPADESRARSASDDSEKSITAQKVVWSYSLHAPRLSAAAAPKMTIVKDEVPKQKKTPKLQTQKTIKTRVGIVTNHFKLVHAVHNGHIDMAQLLQALHGLNDLMVDIGQKQNARELRRNVEKAEAFAKRHCSSSGKISMKQVLVLEKEMASHKYCSRHGQLISLKDPSCAMGLLWTRRSLWFLYHVFESLTQNVDVALGTVFAYEQALLPYHDWIIQKIFGLALRAMTPSNKEYLARLGGFSVETFGAAEEDATKRDLQKLLIIWKPLLQRWEQVYAELDLEDLRRI